MTASSSDMWEFAHDPSDWATGRLIGYSVEASDGGIGKIDDATSEIGANRVVVDTGPWIFGKKVMIPAGMIERVVHDDQTVYVSLSKNQIKDSPEYDDSLRENQTYRDSLSGYYSDKWP